MHRVTDSNWSLRALGIWSICSPKQQKLKWGQQTGFVANWISSTISSVNHENCWTWQQQRLLGDDFIFKLPVQSGSKAGQETPQKLSNTHTSSSRGGSDCRRENTKPTGTGSTAANNITQLNTPECSACDAISSLQVLNLSFTPTFFFYCRLVFLSYALMKCHLSSFINLWLHGEIVRLL